MKRFNKGFTLIEVLVSSLIIVVGVTGFVALQSEYFASDSKINLRAIAMQLGQQKIEDLRDFEVLTTEVGKFAYNDIIDDAGGTLASGNVVVPLSNDGARTQTFTRSWQVTERYFIDTDADATPDTWVDEGNAALPNPAPTVSSQKLVEITIAWTDLDGNAQSLNVEGNIAPIPFSRSFQATNESDNAKTQPRVDYVAGSAPDVVAYDLGNGEKIETSKPIPDIDNQGQNNIVQFQTIRYIDLPDQTDKLEQEDFLTVNCECALAGSGNGETPHMTIYDGSELVVSAGETVTKTIGEAANNQQPAICDTCCRDHHDTSTMVANEQYYRLENGAPHRHYKRQSDGSFDEAINSGDEYDEVCRFRRVDGYFEIYPDWQIVDITDFDSDYLLDSGNLSSYTSYTESVLEAIISGTTLPSKLSNRDLSISPGAHQLIARGLYLDRMTASHISALQSKINNGDADWKAYVPFYDINLTLLSQWSSDDPAIATVSNEDIETIVDPDNDYYGTYSRGRLDGLVDGTTTVTVWSPAYSSSITGTGAISPEDVSNAVSDDTLDVDVDGSSVNLRFGLIAEINCLISVNGDPLEACETNNSNKAAYVDLSQIYVNVTPSSFTCTVNVPRGQSTPFLSCDNISDSWAGYITFSLSIAGATVDIDIRLPDASVSEFPYISLPTGLNQTSSGEYEILIEVTK